MTLDRSKLIRLCRMYYAEVGLILTEIMKEDGATLVRAELDCACTLSLDVQMSFDYETPLRTAMGVSHHQYIDYTAVEEYFLEYENTPVWHDKIREFEKIYLNEYGDDELRIYIVFRRDIGDVLTKAKFGVQCAHATLSVWGRCLQTNPDRAYAYFPCNTDKINSGQAKIVLQIKDDVELLALAEKVKELGFPVVSIVDAARTELSKPTLTAIGIGPIWYKAEGQFLKCLRLYKDTDPEKLV